MISVVNQKACLHAESKSDISIEAQLLAFAETEDVKVNIEEYFLQFLFPQLLKLRRTSWQPKSELAWILNKILMKIQMTFRYKLMPQRNCGILLQATKELQVSWNRQRSEMAHSAAISYTLVTNHILK